MRIEQTALPPTGLSFFTIMSDGGRETLHGEKLGASSQITPSLYSLWTWEKSRLYIDGFELEVNPNRRQSWPRKTTI
jgi:hypothetical protein